MNRIVAPHVHRIMPPSRHDRQEELLVKNGFRWKLNNTVALGFLCLLFC